VKASRLISLLLLLQTRGGMTAQELADQLEVSVRTVYRDVESSNSRACLSTPIGGHWVGIGWSTAYRTRLTGLTGDESRRPVPGRFPGPAAELGLGSVVAAAELKVLAALPAEMSSRVPA